MATRKIGFTKLMTGLYTLLTTDTLTSSYNIYNHVPDNASLPYISLSSPIGVRSSSFSARNIAAEENTIMIHIWSDYKGDKECADMMDNICQAIDGSGVTIASYTNIITLIDYYDIILDTTEPAQPVRHGVMRVEFHMA